MNCAGDLPPKAATKRCSTNKNEFTEWGIDLNLQYFCLFKCFAHCAGPFLVPSDWYICERLLGSWLLGDKLLVSKYLIDKALTLGAVLPVTGDVIMSPVTLRAPFEGPWVSRERFDGLIGRSQGPLEVSGACRDRLGSL